MTTTQTSLLLLALTCLAPGAAISATTFTATLTHDQETGPSGSAPLLTIGGAPRPMSSGTATLTLNDAMTALSFTATIANIDFTGTQTSDTNDNLVAAHIHAPAAPGTNAGVVWGFFGTPDNDVSPKNLIFTPLVGGVGGTISSVWNAPEGNAGTTLTAQLPNLFAGLAYLNLHTVQFPGGEIRGQILPPAGVPDGGSSLLLLAPALLSLLGVRRWLGAGPRAT